MGSEEAVHGGAGVVLIDLEVVPGASASAFPSGYNPWRKRIQARVSAPPVDGRANEELVMLVAGFFGVPAASVSVESGASGRLKRVRVRGVSQADARVRLRKVLP